MKFKKLLSLFTAAAMSASCFVGMNMLTVEAAEDAYAEWVFASSSSYKEVPAVDTNLDGTAPVLSFGGGISSGNICSYYLPSGEKKISIPHKGELTFSGKVYEVKYSKMQGLNRYIQIDTQFDSSKYSSYDVTFTAEFSSRSKNATNTFYAFDRDDTDTADDAVGSIAKVMYGHNDGKTGSEQQATIKDLTSPTIYLKTSTEMRLYAVTVEYNAISSEPSIALSDKAVTMNKGDSKTLTADIKNAEGANIVWTADNDNVSVDENGNVTANEKGTATVTATINVGGVEYSSSCNVTITNTAAVNYSIGDSGAEGVIPENAVVEDGEQFTIPKNSTLYVEGKTLTGWTDGNAVYNIGDVYTVNGDVTLTPVFTENTVALGDAETTLVYEFNPANGAPAINCENKTAIVVYQASVGDQVIDVKLNIDTTKGLLIDGKNGKANNTSRSNDIQINPGTQFKFPVLEGSVVTVGDMSKADGTYTINGVTKTGGNQSETMTEDGTCVINIMDPSGSYWQNITVTYPKQETITPEFVPAEAVKVDRYDRYEGEKAEVYTADLATVSGLTANYVKWTVTLNDDTVAEGVSDQLPELTDVDIVYALIVTGTADKLDSINKVMAVLSSENE